MRRYETIFIVYPDLPDDEIAPQIERYSAIVTAQKGTLIKIEKWGKRKLAYEINKQMRGYYVLVDFAGNSAIVNELERNLRIDEKILKFMTVKVSDSVTLEEIEAEKAASAAAAKAEEALSETEKPKPEATTDSQAGDIAAGDGDSNSAHADEPEEGKE